MGCDSHCPRVPNRAWWLGGITHKQGHKIIAGTIGNSQTASPLAAGLTKARKTQLIRDIVQVTHESIGSDPKIINVLLFEHPADNMSISGRIHGEEAPKQVVEKA